MLAANIKIVRRGESLPWQDQGDYRFAKLDSPIDVAFIETGRLASGAPSVAIRIALADGTHVVAEVSLALWITATAGARGAFPGAFAGGALAADGLTSEQMDRLIDAIEQGAVVVAPDSEQGGE